MTAAPRLSSVPRSSRVATVASYRSVIDEFRTLGHRVDRAWARADLDEAAFSQIATTELAASKLSERVDALDVLRWLATTHDLPPQVDTQFGQPPVVVYRGHRWYIEVIFWLDGSTTIHQHAFSGAFGVLQGSSIESTFEFTVRRRVNSYFLIGDVVTKGVDFLQAGDVRPIAAGDGEIHALFHLERPSVSIVVRTIAEPQALPQYQYAPPSIAYDPFYVDLAYRKRVQGLEVLLKTAHPAYEELASIAISDGTLEFTYAVLESAFRATGADAAARYARLATVARWHHGDVIDRFAPVFREAKRKSTVVGLRAKAHDTDHRFLLALLLNFDRRAHVLEMIARRYPGEDPSGVVERQLGELAASRVLPWELDDAGLGVLRRCLAGASIDESAAAESSAADTSRREAIDRAARRLRDSLVLRPLFTA
jgi:hypothetical protein